MTLRQHDEGLAAKGGRPSHDTEKKPVLARVEVEVGMKRGLAQGFA
jgi:hypothetical protein